MSKDYLWVELCVYDVAMTATEGEDCLPAPVSFSSWCKVKVDFEKISQQMFRFICTVLKHLDTNRQDSVACERERKPCNVIVCITIYCGSIKQKSCLHFNVVTISSSSCCPHVNI